MILSKEARKGRRKLRLPLAPPRGGASGRYPEYPERGGFEENSRAFRSSLSPGGRRPCRRKAWGPPRSAYRRRLGPPTPSAPPRRRPRRRVGRCLRLLLPLRDRKSVV